MADPNKNCPHPTDRQVATAHGLFCLDCGQLLTTKAKNTQTTQKIAAPPPPAAQPTGTPVKISIAGITPRKRLT